MIVEEFTTSLRSFGRQHRVSVRLVYRLDDPVAVHLRIANDEVAHDWTFARSLLVDAFALGVSGLGTVRICRVDVMGETLLWVTLDGVDNTASLALPGDLVSGWLARTERLAPFGAERIGDDWHWTVDVPRVIGVAGAPGGDPGWKCPGALVFTRPGRTRSRRRRGEDPVERPPRHRPARSRLAIARPTSEGDEGDEPAGSSW